MGSNYAKIRITNLTCIWNISKCKRTFWIAGSMLISLLFMKDSISYKMWNLVYLKIWTNINTDFGQAICFNWKTNKEILLTVSEALYHFERNMFKLV